MKYICVTTDTVQSKCKMMQIFSWLLLKVKIFFNCLEWPFWITLKYVSSHSIMCVFSVYLYNLVSLSLSSSCLPSSGTIQSQSLTSVPIVPSHLPTLAIWPNIFASTPEWNPTPATTAKSASDSSVTFSSTTGKWVVGLGFLFCSSVFLWSG